MVPDNLKTGVDKPDLYDPKINRSYAELAEHYGTLVDPARAAKPKDKPRVERPIGRRTTTGLGVAGRTPGSPVNCADRSPERMLVFDTCRYAPRRSCNAPL